MSNLLVWDKPPQTMSKEEWSSFTADSAPPGVYTPNMSAEDRKKWRAKKVADRVEVRTQCRNGTLLKLVVHTDGRLNISANGTAVVQIEDFLRAINEAQTALSSVD